MKINLLLLNFIGVTLLLFSCQNRSSSRASAEDFFQTSEKTNFEISPSGKYISFLKEHEGLRNIFVLEISSGKIERITNSDNLHIRSAFWANDRELIFLLDRGLDDNLRLMSVNRESQQTRLILDLSSARMRWVEPIQVVNNEILISLNDRDPSFFEVYRLNIKTGGRYLVGKNPGNIVRWLTDREGRLRLAVVSDGLTETIMTRDNEDEEFMPVIKSLYKSSVKPLGFAASDSNRIYALSNRRRDKLALVEIDLNTGKEVRILYQHPEVDLNAEGYSKQSGQMDFVEYDAQRPGRYSLHPKMKDVFSKIESQIPNYAIKLIGRDSLFKGFLIQASLDVDPGATYYYNYESDELVKLAEENSLLSADDLSPMLPVSFYTRDSIKLSGYLTIPKKGSGKLPTIIIPPPGINSRAVWRYNPEVQFLASQGYAVFQVNTRGLVGFGKENWQEGFKNWGTTMQNDITDATNWLVREGVADSSRIGLYGFSLGGYFALHSSCYRSDLYACAASYSGITNLFTYLKEVPTYFEPYRQKIFETVGDPVADSEYFRKHSPIFHADKIKRPIFIAQGGRDSRSNVNETNQLVKNLRAKGISVTYMLKNEEGHKFENQKNKIFFYNELASFFNRNL